MNAAVKDRIRKAEPEIERLGHDIAAQLARVSERPHTPDQEPAE